MMDAKFLKIVMLAAVSDGQIQAEELEMLNQIKTLTELKSISDEAARAAMADVYNKFAAGRKPNIFLISSAVNFLTKRKVRFCTS